MPAPSRLRSVSLRSLRPATALAVLVWSGCGTLTVERRVMAGMIVSGADPHESRRESSTLGRFAAEVTRSHDPVLAEGLFRTRSCSEQTSDVRGASDDIILSLEGVGSVGGASSI